MIMMIMIMMVITIPLSGGECPSTWRKHDRDGPPEVLCARDYIPGDNDVDDGNGGDEENDYGETHNSDGSTESFSGNCNQSDVQNLS